jgi:hypothetical protein
LSKKHPSTKEDFDSVATTVAAKEAKEEEQLDVAIEE